MSIDLTLPILTGFFASFHCVGMCGPIVTTFVAQRPIAIQLPGSASLRLVQTVMPQVLYNLGRIVSYGSIGLVAGAVGSVGLIDPTLQKWTSIFFGVVMLLMGLSQLKAVPLPKSTKPGLVQKIFTTLSGSRSGESQFLIGLLTPLLPCGLLYGMAAQAAMGGSPVGGALTMSAFALGAIPALVVTGIAASFVNAKLRTIGTWLAALLIIAMGLLIIARGLGMTHYALPMTGAEHLCGQ